MHFVHGGTDTERYMQMSLYLLAFRLQFLNKLELSLYTVYSAFESTLNSSIVSYRMSWVESTYSTAFSRTNSRPGLRSSDTAVYVRPRCRTRFRQRGLEQSSRPPPQLSNARPSLFKRRLKTELFANCAIYKCHYYYYYYYSHNALSTRMLIMFIIFCHLLLCNFDDTSVCDTTGEATALRVFTTSLKLNHCWWHRRWRRNHVYGMSDNTAGNHLQQDRLMDS